MSSDPKDVTKTRANKRVVVACSAFVASMIGVSYAAVPLYQLFCQVTGYGGTTQRVEQMSDTVLDRTIKVRFDSNVAGGLPWDFKPVQREVELRIGETVQVAYTARNTSTWQTPARQPSTSRRWRLGPISTRSSVSALPKAN
jgi:cytochrome c oxidase assembly protein subunit 11